ncbi:hypothetical protein [Alkalihalobacillus sp. LMS39]|uniref:hypothetical protein n=1 Tax=Alkalihalobacillus sp. LMS39 TaxID=2924032 RepID=UPI001FB4A529|nr:hypothetical protein [Alkalihalobacillus sp. LMS39]UOE93319.1 hypothetical protein MM271_19300 [Alkalihalobacillus sp. LMS39]
MNYILLITAIFVLLFSLRQMTMIEKRKSKTTTLEIKQNITLLLCGIPTIVALLFIPYQVWVLFGKSHDWDGVYTIGGTAIIVIAISFVFYYKRKLKFN